MADLPTQLAARLDAGDWAAVDEAVERLEESWRAVGTGDIAMLLPPSGDAQRQRVLVELIKADQEYRWKSVEKRFLESYLEEWPELRSSPSIIRELLETECLTRASFDVIPTAEELQSRFAGIANEIDLAAIKAQADEERSSGPCSSTPYATSAETSKDSVEHTPAAGPTVAPLSEGKFFGRDDRYKIEQLLGQGGMGTVYRACDTRLGREVALKIPRIDPVADPAVRERFVRESRAAAGIRHPNICPIFDAHEFQGTFYIAMALIEGQSLDEWQKGRQTDPREAAELVCKLSRALAAVHARGIVHRDIKPSNVMIDRSGEPLLMDFGLARLAQEGPTEIHTRHAGDEIETRSASEEHSPDGDGQFTRAGFLLGTLRYMSPEQTSGRAVDSRTDIYSLGVLFYQLLTGRMPFEGTFDEIVDGIRNSVPPRPSIERPGLDPELEAICVKMLAKLPADRYQSADDLAKAIRRYLDTSSGNGKPPRGNRWLAWGSAAGGGLLLLLAIVFLIVFFRSGGKVVPPPAQPPAAACPLLPIERWIETGPRVSGMQFSEDEGRFYLSYSLCPSPGQVVEFETASGKILQTITSPATPPNEYYDHKGLALSADDRYLYVTNFFRKDISRFDLHQHNARTDLPIGGVPVNGHAWATLIGRIPDKRKLAVLLGCDNRSYDMDNDGVSIVDIADGHFSLIGEVRLKDEPTGQIAMSSDSRCAYIITRPRKTPAPTLCEVSLTPPFKAARVLPFPDGNLVGVAVCDQLRRAFVSDLGARKLWVVDLDAFKTVSELKLDGYAPGPLAVNGRGDLLAALCPEARKLFLFDPADGTKLGQVNDLREGATGVEFSKDGRQMFVWHGALTGGVAVVNIARLQGGLVFSSNRGGEGYQIYRLPRGEKEPLRLTNNHAADRCPRWSPDTRRIAFISTAPGKPRVCITNRRGAEPLVLKETDPIMPDRGAALDWSPDGREIAFIGGDGRAIRAVEVGTGKVRSLVDGEIGGGCTNHFSLTWRRLDGQIVVSSQSPDSAHQQGLFLIDPKTRRIAQLISSGGNWDFLVAAVFSPDGKQIGALRPASLDGPAEKIYLAGPNGQDVNCLVATETKYQRALRWSPDGKRLVYSAAIGGRYHVSIVNVLDGKSVQLTTGDSDDIEPDICGSTSVVEQPAGAAEKPAGARK